MFQYRPDRAAVGRDAEVAWTRGASSTQKDCPLSLDLGMHSSELPKDKTRVLSCLEFTANFHWFLFSSVSGHVAWFSA